MIEEIINICVGILFFGIVAFIVGGAITLHSTLSNTIKRKILFKTIKKYIVLGFKYIIYTLIVLIVVLGIIIMCRGVGSAILKLIF